MKNVCKILLMLIIVILIFEIVPKNISYAATESIINRFKPEDNGKIKTTKIEKVIARVIGVLQFLSGFLAIITIAVTGFNYVTGGPEVKSDMKRKMLPIVISLALIFGAVTLAGFIIANTEITG